MPAPDRRRCATYTRKSSEEGLEQDFNSLDAQREACEAYIRSQKSEGWTLISTRYDDGGYSGGTLDRPGLTRLLEDIDAGKIDTVVVYKVDRLTRSLADFAKIVEVLDAQGASFVSVTQQFNTTTSMGRLTLNMLLSFAQFEREVTGERIRDKIAASKRKGLWMGGPVPLGYEPDGRTLVVVESEAETVRTLFRLYLEWGSVRWVKEEADRVGLRTKVREGADERMRGGRLFSRGSIYKLLGNPLYIGRIAHNAENFEGQHPAIVDPETWDAVQKRLAKQAPNRADRPNARGLSPLGGKLFDETGTALTPSHTVKSGRRYRYYISRDSSGNSAMPKRETRSSALRLPAREIESRIGRLVETLIGSPPKLALAARNSGIDETAVSRILEHASHWHGNPLHLVQRVVLRLAEIELHLDLSAFTSNSGFLVRYIAPISIRRRGVESRLVLAQEDSVAGSGRSDPALIKAIVRGRRWFDQMASGEATSISELAKTEGVTDQYVARILQLAFLAPEIVSHIVAGTQPVELTAEVLTKRTDLPISWTDQAVALGLASNDTII